MQLKASRPFFWSDLGVALSSANLFFFKQWSDLTLSSTSSPHTDWTYEVISATPNSFIAITLMVIALASVFFGLVRLARRHKSRKLLLLSHLLMLVSLVSMANGLRISYGLGLYLAPLGLLRFPLYALGGVLVLYFFVKKNRIFVDLYRILATVLIPFIAVTFAHAAGGYYSAVTARNFLTKFVRDLPHVEPQPKGQRVVVNLFDELDYHRIVDPEVSKNLPEMAAWRNQSLFAHNARPPGRSTAYSIPSFFLGEKISEPLFLKKGRLVVATNENGETKTKKWREQMNLILQLKREGYKVAVIGWYIPYCRMFFYSTDRCERFSHYNFLKQPYSDSLGKSIEGLAREVVEIRPTRQKAHLAAYRGILKASKEVLDDPSYDFVFIHWPVPHAPWIYSADKGFTDENRQGPEGYFANLLGVEETMKLEREWLTKNGTWDRTSIVLLSDHGWNTSMEYDGTWDIRTPFMVKLPGQTEGMDYFKPFNTVLLRDLVTGVLHQKINSKSALVSWLDDRSDKETNEPSS